MKNTRKDPKYDPKHLWKSLSPSLVAERFKGQRRTPKPKNRTNSTKEFSEQIDGVTGHYPVKQGFLGELRQKVHPKARRNLFSCCWKISHRHFSNKCSPPKIGTKMTSLQWSAGSHLQSELSVENTLGIWGLNRPEWRCCGSLAHSQA